MKSEPETDLITADRGGQYRLIPSASLGVVDASREKRASLDERIAEVARIIEAHPKRHHLLWHDLEDERESLESLPFVASVYGKQDDDEQEQTPTGSPGQTETGS